MPVGLRWFVTGAKQERPRWEPVHPTCHLERSERARFASLLAESKDLCLAAPLMLPARSRSLDSAESLARFCWLGMTRSFWAADRPGLQLPVPPRSFKFSSHDFDARPSNRCGGPMKYHLLKSLAMIVELSALAAAQDLAASRSAPRSRSSTTA